MKPKESTKDDIETIKLKLESYDDLLKTAELMAEKLRFYSQQKNWASDGKIINDRNQDTCAGRYMYYGTKASDGLAAYLGFRDRYFHDATDFHRPDDWSSVPGMIVVNHDIPSVIKVECEKPASIPCTPVSGGCVSAGTCSFTGTCWAQGTALPSQSSFTYPATTTPSSTGYIGYGKPTPNHPTPPTHPTI